MSDDKISPKANPLDTLCATLEGKMAYDEGERDLIVCPPLTPPGGFTMRCNILTCGIPVPPTLLRGPEQGRQQEHHHFHPLRVRCPRRFRRLHCHVPLGRCALRSGQVYPRPLFLASRLLFVVPLALVKLLSMNRVTNTTPQTAVKQVLNGTLSEKGILAPMSTSINNPLMKELKENHGLVIP